MRKDEAEKQAERNQFCKKKGKQLSNLQHQLEEILRQMDEENLYIGNLYSQIQTAATTAHRFAGEYWKEYYQTK